MRYNIALLSLLLQWLSICSALPTTFPANNYAKGCFGMVQKTYLWSKCSGLPKSRLNKCFCNLPEAMETCVSCMDQLISNVTSSERETLRKKAYKALVAQCKGTKMNISQIEQYHNRGESLKPYEKKHPKQRPGTWKATNAFKPTAWECQKSLPAYYGSSQLHPLGLRACAAMLAYWAGVSLIRFLVHWIYILCPKSFHATNTKVLKKLRQFFTIPALFRYRHSEAVYATRYVPFNIPTREQSLVILGFVILHLGLTFGYNPYYRDSYLYLYDNVLAYNSVLAFRTGKIAVYELPLLILFAGRNNFLQWLTGWSHDTFVVYHKWIARCIGFSVLTHSVNYTIARLHKGNYYKMWSLAYWNWGVAGTVGCCVIIFQGMAAIRRANYEVFLILHILLALLCIIGGYYHLKLKKEELQYFYATFAVWGFDRAFRLLRVLINNPFAKAHIRLHGDDTLEFTIKYSQLWKPKPGDYAFIHVAQRTYFWESHPFTLSRGVLPEEENTLKLFCRVKDGMTRRTAQRALENGGAFTTGVWIDGPYGPSYNMKGFNEVLFIAGGIGITAPFSYIQRLLQDSTSDISKITLYWAVRDESALQWFKNQLEYLNKSKRVNINVVIGGSHKVDPDLERENFNLKQEIADLGYVSTMSSTAQESSEVLSGISQSNSEKSSKQMQTVFSVNTVTDSSSFNITSRSLNIVSLVQNTIKNSQGSLGILCCGPGTMNDDCRYAVANGLSMTPNFVEYFEESFSW